MNNQLDFTQEMMEMMRAWKGGILQSYTENSNDGYVTAVRVGIDYKSFDIRNNYTLFIEASGEEVEFSCFTCLEGGDNQPLEPSVVGGRNRENIIQEKIENVFIVTEIESNHYPNGERFEFSHQVACIIQTESKFYVIWRYLIFNTLTVSVCVDMKSAIESIKELNEDDEGIENVTIKKNKIVEKL